MLQPHRLPDSGDRPVLELGKETAVPVDLGRLDGKTARHAICCGLGIVPRSIHRIIAFVVLTNACMRADEQHDSQAPQRETDGDGLALTASRAVIQPRPPAPDLGPDTQAVAEKAPPREVVQLAHFADVREAPAADSPLIGIVAMGERVAVHERIQAPGCAGRWMAIAPRGFVCADGTPTRRAPSQTMLPRLSRRSIVPGTYAKVRGDEAMVYASLDDAVRRRGGQRPSAELTVRRLSRKRAGGRSFWRTRHGWVATEHLRQLDSSRFQGVDLTRNDAPLMPLAWARFRGDDGKIAVRDRPSRRARPVRRLRARSHATVSTVSPDGEFVHLVGVGWVLRDEVRIAMPSDVPADVSGNERWIDIDVDQQVLVAYEGARPVFATLVSTGRRGHDSPLGTYRIERKVAERTMNSRPSDDDPYAVDRVPWTAYFTGSFALHGAYWHGSFGERKSHGCINLAPIDARRVYGWSEPQVAPGWSEAYASEASRGSVVRLRSSQG